MPVKIPSPGDLVSIPVHVGNADNDPIIIVIKTPDFQTWDAYERTRTETRKELGKDGGIFVTVNHDADFKIIHDHMVAVKNALVKIGGKWTDLDEYRKAGNEDWKDKLPPVWTRRAAEWFYQAGTGKPEDEEKK